MARNGEYWKDYSYNKILAKNVQDQCINSVRILIKASYQTVLNCLLLDHFLSSINFPSEQALKLGFDLMAPFWTHLQKISFIFDFQLQYYFSLPLPPLNSFFFFFFFPCTMHAILQRTLTLTLKTDMDIFCVLLLFVGQLFF